MRTQRKLVPIVWTPELLLAAARGEFKVYRCEQVVRFKLTSAQWAAFELAQTAGYAAVRENNSQHPLLSVWFIWCELHNLPYIVVRAKQKYATVSMDLIAASYKLNEQEQVDLNARVRPLANKRKPPYGFTAGKTHSYTRAPIDNAHLIAWYMLETALQARRREYRGDPE